MIVFRFVISAGHPYFIIFLNPYLPPLISALCCVSALTLLLFPPFFSCPFACLALLLHFSLAWAALSCCLSSVSLCVLFFCFLLCVWPLSSVSVAACCFDCCLPDFSVLFLSLLPLCLLCCCVLYSAFLFSSSCFALMTFLFYFFCFLLHPPFSLPICLSSC
jgi:hypothetical protein